MKKLFLLFVLIPLLFACEEKVTEKNLDRNASVEAKITVDSIAGNQFVLTTSYIVWQKNKAVATFRHLDTIPAITEKELVTVEDKDGNEQDVKIPKRYELYITVK